MNVAERIAAVRQRIEQAGRDPSAIDIVAVTKGFGPEACREAISAGLPRLGENRVQEALGKMDAVQGAQWHLIGHLQSNKVRHAAGRFALIQSVDTVKLAEQIARTHPAQQVLVEVNVSREPQKSGAPPDQALDVVAGVARLLDLRGLMAMGPTQDDPAGPFKEVKRLHDDAEQLLGKRLPILSMGMSRDFEAALAAGSTMLRLGQVLFGPRPA